MKLIQRIAATVAVLVMIATAQHAHAQMTGAWSNAPANDPEIVKAANFAVEEHSREEPVTLKKIVRARQQVVAGMNYKVTLLVKRNKKRRKAVAVVWYKTDGTYALTSWKWAGSK